MKTVSTQQAKSKKFPKYAKCINTAKLKSMGLKVARAACERHALRALEFQEQKNWRKFNMHVDLLDQCAVVGRQLKREQA